MDQSYGNDNKEQNTRKARSQAKPLWIKLLVAAGIVILLVGIGLFIWKQTQSSTPLPKEIVKQANFSVYYPSELPKGYTYKEESASFENEALIYILKGPGDITVTQQSLPKDNIQYDKIPGFTSVATNSGQAHIGEISGRRVAIVQTPATLLTITSGPEVPVTVLTQVAKNLASTQQ